MTLTSGTEKRIAHCPDCKKRIIITKDDCSKYEPSLVSMSCPECGIEFTMNYYGLPFMRVLTGGVEECSQ